jgi:hypothetical protein
MHYFSAHRFFAYRMQKIRMIPETNLLIFTDGVNIVFLYRDNFFSVSISVSGWSCDFET